MNIFLFIVYIVFFPPIFELLLGIFFYYALKLKKIGYWFIASSMTYFPFDIFFKSKIVKLCPHDCSNAHCGIWTCPNYKPEINHGRIKRK